MPPYPLTSLALKNIMSSFWGIWNKTESPKGTFKTRFQELPQEAMIIFRFSSGSRRTDEAGWA